MKIPDVQKRVYAYIRVNYVTLLKHDLIYPGPEPSQINLTNTPLALATAESRRYFELRGK